MARKPPPPAMPGRGQGGRPAPGVDAARQSHGPRILPGAMSVPIEQLVPDPDQPRRDMGGDRLTDLAASLKEYGALQPLLVREDGYLDDGRTRYMIVAGGRRYAAALLAGVTRLPVVVKETEDAALRMTQLVENIQRQDLAPLEEARAFQELMDAEGLTAAALATRLHISPQKVRDRLLVLTDQVMADAVQRGQITSTTARDVLRMADEAQVPLRARMAEGERVDGATIQAARAQAAVSGIANQRSKGGGRSARSRPPTEPGPPAQEHTAYVPAIPTKHADGPPIDAPEAREAHYQRALGSVDGPALEVVLLHGVERGWSCQELLQAIRERQGRQRSGAEDDKR